MGFKRLKSMSFRGLCPLDCPWNPRCDGRALRLLCSLRFATISFFFSTIKWHFWTKPPSTPSPTFNLMLGINILYFKSYNPYMKQFIIQCTGWSGECYWYSNNNMGIQYYQEVCNTVTSNHYALAAGIWNTLIWNKWPLMSFMICSSKGMERERISASQMCFWLVFHNCGQ